MLDWFFSSAVRDCIAFNQSLLLEVIEFNLTMIAICFGNLASFNQSAGELNSWRQPFANRLWDFDPEYPPWQ
jgi:hypothetical protein